jgi:hypothetical protein
MMALKIGKRFCGYMFRRTLSNVDGIGFAHFVDARVAEVAVRTDYPLNPNPVPVGRRTHRSSLVAVSLLTGPSSRPSLSAMHDNRIEVAHLGMSG